MAVLEDIGRGKDSGREQFTFALVGYGVSDIEPPIVLVDGQDVTFFTSVPSLLSWVELVDLQAARYEAFDATGSVLKFNLPPDDGSRHIGQASLTQSGARAGERLREILLERFRSESWFGSVAGDDELSGVVARMAGQVGFIA